MRAMAMESLLSILLAKSWSSPNIFHTGFTIFAVSKEILKPVTSLVVRHCELCNFRCAIFVHRPRPENAVFPVPFSHCAKPDVYINNGGWLGLAVWDNIVGDCAVGSFL
jgi:hypothetical protein